MILNLIYLEDLFWREAKPLWRRERFVLSTTVGDIEHLSSGKDRRNEIRVQLLTLNWLKQFISNLCYKYLNRIYILNFCKLQVYCGNHFWMASVQEAVEHSVTATALLLETARCGQTSPEALISDVTSCTDPLRSFPVAYAHTGQSRECWTVGPSPTGLYNQFISWYCAFSYFCYILLNYKAFYKD